MGAICEEPSGAPCHPFVRRRYRQGFQPYRAMWKALRCRWDALRPCYAALPARRRLSGRVMGNPAAVLYLSEPVLSGSPRVGAAPRRFARAPRWDKALRTLSGLKWAPTSLNPEATCSAALPAEPCRSYSISG
jgi:hypothetical protein